VSRQVVPSADWEACPIIDTDWEPVLNRITALRNAGLHTTMLLAHYTERSIAPLQEHEGPMWLYSGDLSDPLRFSSSALDLEAVEDIVKR